jgi:conjugal transfer ATP-binding protein TraC
MALEIPVESKNREEAMVRKTPAEIRAEEAATTKAEAITLEEEKIYRRGLVDIKDLISPAAFEVKPSFLILGETYVRTLFVLSYPRYVTVGWFTPIINLSKTLDVAMFFYPVKSEIILKQLKKRVGNLQAQLDRKSTRLNSSHTTISRMPSSA